MEETPTTYTATKATKLERDPIKTVIMASMIGTAIEFFLIFTHMELPQQLISRTSFSQT